MTLLAASLCSALCLGPADNGADRACVVVLQSQSVPAITPIPLLQKRLRLGVCVAAPEARFVPMPLPTRWNAVAMPIPTTWNAKVDAARDQETLTPAGRVSRLNGVPEAARGRLQRPVAGGGAGRTIGCVHATSYSPFSIGFGCGAEEKTFART